MNWSGAGLAACTLLWSLAGPVSAQSGAEHRFTIFDHPTPLGPLRVAFRVRTPQERSATSLATHEFFFAHPVWGHGYYVERLEWRCSSREAAGTNSTLWRWDGTEGARRGLVLEGDLDYPIQTVIGEAGYEALISRVICDGQGGGIVRDRTAAIAALRQAAGGATMSWPRHKITLSQGSVMRVAVPKVDAEGRPHSMEFSPSMEATDASGRDLGAEGVTLTGATITRPSAALDHTAAILREQGAIVLRHERLGDWSSYALDHLTVRDSDGRRREIRIKACANRPNLVYAAWAEFGNDAEQVFALRFINSMYVSCSNPTR